MNRRILQIIHARLDQTAPMTLDHLDRSAYLVCRENKGQYLYYEPYIDRGLLVERAGRIDLVVHDNAQHHHPQKVVGGLGAGAEDGVVAYGGHDCKAI